MIEMIAHHALDQTLGVGAGKPVFGLALEFGFANENRQYRASARHNVVGGNEASLTVAGAFTMGAQRLSKRITQALFMGAALGRGDGVAIGSDEGIDGRRPSYRPLHRAATVAIFRAASEVARVHDVRRSDLAFEEIKQAAGKFECIFLGRLVL